MAEQYPEVPQAQQQIPVAVEAEISLEELGKQASQAQGMPHGKFRVRVNMFEWKNSQAEVTEGISNYPKSGNSQLSYTVVEVLEGDQSTVGKKDKFFNHFKSGITNGFPWSGEKDAMGFLMKHGITPAQLGTTEVRDAMGVRIAKDTFSPWFQYIGDFGGEYVIERRPNKNNADKTSEFIREYPICFDAEGNALPRPMPSAPVASVPVPQPVAAPVAVPVVAQPVPVAAPQEVPVAQPTTIPVAVPVAAPVVPVAVPLQPVAPVVPVAAPVQPVAAPVVPVAAAPVPQAVPTGLPAGLPGMPVVPVA